jgi:hypothetical protein
MFTDRKTPKDYIKVGLAGKLAQELESIYRY